MRPLCYLVEDGSIADLATQHISSAEAGKLQHDTKEQLLQLRFSSSSLKHPTVMERALQVRRYLNPNVTSTCSVSYNIGRVRCLPDGKDSLPSGPNMPFDVTRTAEILRDVM